MFSPKGLDDSQDTIAESPPRRILFVQHPNQGPETPQAVTPVRDEPGTRGLLVATILNTPISTAARISKASHDASPTHEHVTELTDFDVLKPISNGAYGKVFLVKKKASGALFAMKAMRKELLQKKNMVDQVITERNALALVNNPFIVRLFYSFCSKSDMFLVMEYMIGGDLSSLLHAFGAFEEPMAVFYLAEISLALQYLHQHGIVHRDLKPDNVLLNEKGHIKLTDFGLSQVTMDAFSARELQEADWIRTPGQIMSLRSEFSANLPAIDSFVKSPTKFSSPSGIPVTPRTTKCTPRRQLSTQPVYGTPDYLAPELLQQHPHGCAVDLWALGVIAFELLTGIPPFNDETTELVFCHIVECDIPWPEAEPLSHESILFIKQLLSLNPDDRPTAIEICAAPLFAHIDWNHILEEVSPFVPCPDNELDTSYFDVSFRTKLSLSL